MKTILLAILTTFVFIYNPVHAQEKHKLPAHAIVFKDDPGWHKISEIQLSGKGDSIPVPVQGLHKYRAFRLYATEAGVDISTMKIFYETGEVADTTLNMRLKDGETSKHFRINKSSMVVGILYICMPKKADSRPHLWLYGLI